MNFSHHLQPRTGFSHVKIAIVFVFDDCFLNVLLQRTLFKSCIARSNALNFLTGITFIWCKRPAYTLNTSAIDTSAL